MWKVLAAMPRHKIHLPPPSLRCLHCRGESPCLFYRSTYSTRDLAAVSGTAQGAGECLSERRGTAFFNLKTPEAEVCSSLDARLARRHARPLFLTHAATIATLSAALRRRAAPRTRAVLQDARD